MKTNTKKRVDLSFMSLKDSDEEDLESQFCQQTQWIYLNQNSLQTIPKTITTLSNLRGLTLQCNKIQSIPSSISSLEKLEHLNLQSNDIRAIPASVVHLTNLRILDLTNNPHLGTKVPATKHSTHSKEKTQSVLKEIYERYNPIERATSATLCFLFVFKHSSMIQSITKDVCKMIAKLIFESRYDLMWNNNTT